MRIQFDETNLLADLVGGAHGLSRAEIKGSAGLASDSLKAVRRISEKGVQGFPHLPFQDATIKSIRKYARQVKGSYDTVCVVGIGGSALGAWALDCGMRGPHPVQGEFSEKNPRLVILDNVDPSFVSAALKSMTPKRTLVVTVAKSGSTAETLATHLVVEEWLRKSLGGKKASRHIAVVTSEGKGDLAALAGREGYRTFALPENVGGRFSVLSAVGLLPAALIGIDVRDLAKGAAAMTHTCWQADLGENTALRAALCHYLIWTRRNKPIQVAFPYANRFWGLALWFRQLWAESLGKAKDRAGKVVNVGQTPVVALGATDQHSQVQLYVEGPNDKVFTFWAVEKYPASCRIPKVRPGLAAFDYLAGQSLDKLIDAERRATAAALVEAQRPNCTFTLGRIDAEHLGAFLQLMEFETAFVGEMLNIDAFNQEGVELGKKFTFGLMGRKGYEEYRGKFQAYEKKRAGPGEAKPRRKAASSAARG
ncbi:MAG: glucose-6-phosphate isomerase [Bryobacteraceae bacterium]